MAGDEAREPDVEITASAAAGELRFDTKPEVRVRFPGAGRRDSGQVTRRENVDTPVRPGKTYRRVFAATRIGSCLLDGDELDKASTAAAESEELREREPEDPDLPRSSRKLRRVWEFRTWLADALRRARS